MTQAGSPTFFATDAWRWWQGRRLGYNLALAVAGWLAYALDIALFYGFRHPVWMSWQGAVSMTLFMGCGFLLLMFVANICFLLGPLIESMVAPADIEGYRAKAWRMGLWGSCALPFLVPLGNLALLIGAGSR